MRTGLFILPFLTFVLGAIALAISSSFPDQPLYGQIGLFIAITPLIMWVVMEFQNIRQIFGRRGSRYGASSGLTVVLGILVIVGIGFLTNKPRFNKSWDTTRAGANTLSDQTLKVLKKIAAEQKQVNIVAFIQEETVQQSFRDLLSLYLPHASGLKVEYVDPRADPTRAIAAKITSNNTAIITQGEQEVRLNTFNEEKLTNSLIKVLKERAKKIYFLSGHGEGEISSEEATGFSIISEILKTHRYDVASLALLEKGAVPDDADLLILAGPKYEMRPQESAVIEKYLKKGGALFALADAVAPVTQINEMLAKFGLGFASDLLILRPDDPRAAYLGQNTALVSEFDAFNPVTKDFAQQSNVMLTMANTRSLLSNETNDYQMKVELVGKTSEVIIRVKDVTSEKDLSNLSEDRIVEGAVPVIAVATGKIALGTEMAKNANPNSNVATDAGVDASGISSESETRIVVVGSAQLASNFGTQRAENRDIVLNTINYLVQDEDFISIRPKDLEKTTLSLTSGFSQLLLVMLSYLYPFVFLGMGTYFWLRRRNA